LLARVVRNCGGTTAAIDNVGKQAEFPAMEYEYNRIPTIINTITDGLERMRLNAALSRPQVSIAMHAAIVPE
jgi:hypothetical protein